MRLFKPATYLTSSFNLFPIGSFVSGQQKTFHFITGLLITDIVWTTCHESPQVDEADIADASRHPLCLHRLTLNRHEDRESGNNMPTFV